MRQTSIDAYEQIKSEGLLSKLQLQIYDTLYRNGPLTAQETWHMLRDEQAMVGEARINGITPRFSELAARGVVKEVGTRKCRISGRVCIVWDVTSSLPTEPVSEKVISEKDILRNQILKLETELRGLREHIAQGALIFSGSLVGGNNE